LFEASVRYSKFSKVSVQNLEELHLNYFESEFEKYYLIDMVGTLGDGKIENEESYFLYKLAEMIKIPDAFVTESIESTDAFITKHKSKILILIIQTLSKHFYDQTTQSVITLITRNKID
jgi:hypothetical protein